MKKGFALLLAVIMAWSLAACGNSDSGAKGSTLVYGSGDYDSINHQLPESIQTHVH